MRLLYSIAIILYATAVRLVSPFHEKAKLMRQGWKNWRNVLVKQCEKLPGSRVVWFHASSLGEFEQARPVLEQFRKEHPDYNVVLTFFSPSGYEVRKGYNQADIVCYLPPDTQRNAKDFVSMIHPDIAYFVKYDFWFNYLNVLADRKVPTYLFSSIFRPNQYFFKCYGSWFARQLQCFSHIFVQNKESMQLLSQIGYTRCSLAGDTRFDRVFDIAAQSKKFSMIERFIADQPVLMAGSSWEPDEKNIKHFIDSYNKPLKVILAPHMIGPDHLTHIEMLFGADNCLRYSMLDLTDEAMLKRKVLIIDNIGMLSSLYRYATVAYIGGGFGKGIHNILEAAVFGHPVCFGPNHKKFQEAVDMLECGGAKTYTSPEQLTEILTLWLDNPLARQEAADAATGYMQQHRGSTAIIIEKTAIE